MTECPIKSRNWYFSWTFWHTSLDFDAKTTGMKFTVLWIHWGIHSTLCAPIWQHSYILCKTKGALFYRKSVTDHVMLACLTSESSVFHEQHVLEMCHMSLRHWWTFPAFSLFSSYSLFFHSVYPGTNMMSDTSSSVYILYIT